METMKTFGTIISEARRAEGLSQKELAAKIKKEDLAVLVYFGEGERSVLRRLNCVAYSSGTPFYRLSQTGGAAESLSIGQIAP